MKTPFTLSILTALLLTGCGGAPKNEAPVATATPAAPASTAPASAADAAKQKAADEKTKEAKDKNDGFAFGPLAPPIPPVDYSPTDKAPTVNERRHWLMGSNGRTLYIYVEDKPGKTPQCNDECAKNWPPLLVAGNPKPTGDFNFVQRKDGTRQWTYKGKPLYFYIKDDSEWKAFGQGLGPGKWKYIKTPRKTETKTEPKS